MSILTKKLLPHSKKTTLKHLFFAGAFLIILLKIWNLNASENKISDFPVLEEFQNKLLPHIIHKIDDSLTGITFLEELDKWTLPSWDRDDKAPFFSFFTMSEAKKYILPEISPERIIDETLLEQFYHIKNYSKAYLNRFSFSGFIPTEENVNISQNQAQVVKLLSQQIDIHRHNIAADIAKIPNSIRVLFLGRSPLILEMYYKHNFSNTNVFHIDYSGRANLGFNMNYEEPDTNFFKDQCVRFMRSLLTPERRNFFKEYINSVINLEELGPIMIIDHFSTGEGAISFVKLLHEFFVETHNKSANLYLFNMGGVGKVAKDKTNIDVIHERIRPFAPTTFVHGLINRDIERQTASFANQEGLQIAGFTFPPHRWNKETHDLLKALPEHELLPKLNYQLGLLFLKK